MSGSATRFIVTSVLVSLLFYLSEVRVSEAGEISISTETLDLFLKKRGEGAVSQREKCPKTNTNVQYIVDYKVVPIDDSSSAVAVFTMACPEGNSTDQFLMIIRNGNGRVIASDLIGDLRFKGDDMWVGGDTIYLKGVKWLGGDAHCCPSKEGTFEYNISNGSHKFHLKGYHPHLK
jgi:hypothetical protein